MCFHHRCFCCFFVFFPFGFACSSLGGVMLGRLISYPNTFWKLIMDDALALCTCTNAQMDRVHAVSEGFAWHVIRHMLNAATCACVYLQVAKREEWMLPAVLQMYQYWFYHKGCKSIYLNPTKRLRWVKSSWLICLGSRQDAIKTRVSLRFKDTCGLLNLCRDGNYDNLHLLPKSLDCPPPFAPTVSFCPTVAPRMTQLQPSTGQLHPR